MEFSYARELDEGAFDVVLHVRYRSFEIENVHSQRERERERKGERKRSLSKWYRRRRVSTHARHLKGDEHTPAKCVTRGRGEAMGRGLRIKQLVECSWTARSTVVVVVLVVGSFFFFLVFGKNRLVGQAWDDSIRLMFPGRGVPDWDRQE